MRTDINKTTFKPKKTALFSLLIKHPDASARIFYDSVPESLFWPVFVIATLAAMIASQAMISATFSCVKQAMALGCFPRLKIIHTSMRRMGQIYIPVISWFLMIMCILVVSSTTHIVNAYGQFFGFEICVFATFFLTVMHIWFYGSMLNYQSEVRERISMLDRKVSLLSGGEKASFAFCKFMVTPSTLLVLDEPTNHLDIPSKERLEVAINEYPGTVIAISHDRYFIKQIVNRVIEVEDGCLEDYTGDYNYYLEKNLEAREKAVEREAELEEKAPKVKAKSKMSKAEKEARKKQKMQAFQQSKQKSKASKNSKRWN